MLLEGLKMQANCTGVSPREWAAETAGGTMGENVLRGGLGERFDPPGRSLAVKSGEAGGFDGGSQLRDKKGRGEGSGGMVEGLVFRCDVEGLAAEPADEGVQRAPRGSFRSEERRVGKECR